MVGFTLRSATLSDLEAMTRLAEAAKRRPESHCIQSDSADTPEGIAAEMRTLFEAGTLPGWVAEADGTIVGCITCEIDVEAGRGWIRGPLVLDTPPAGESSGERAAAGVPDHAGARDAAARAWNATAASLYDALLESLPPAITHFDVFVNAANTRVQRFYADRGFARMRAIHVYVADPSRVSLPEPAECAPRLETAHYDAFVALHDELFPGIYFTGRRILDRLDDDHVVFAHVEDGELLGYCHASVDRDAVDGFIDNLGTRADARGRGIGRRLLRTALRWSFVDNEMPTTGLTVYEELDNAQALYESVGFRLKHTGVHWRKTA